MFSVFSDKILDHEYSASYEKMCLFLGVVTIYKFALDFTDVLYLLLFIYLGFWNAKYEGLHHCVTDLAVLCCYASARVGSGHYTAYGLHEGCWYHFNDSTVTVVSEDTVAKAKAYILFYTERTEQDNTGSVSKPKL